MGEIADMMLEGDLCAGCGEYLDDNGGSGIPRYCSAACARACGAEQHDPRPGPASYKCQKRLRAKIEAFGTLHQHDAYHWTVRIGGKVVADWWPHKRQWRIAGKTERGDEEQFIKSLSTGRTKATGAA